MLVLSIMNADAKPVSAGSYTLNTQVNAPIPPKIYNMQAGLSRAKLLRVGLGDNDRDLVCSAQHANLVMFGVCGWKDGVPYMREAGVVEPNEACV